MLSKKEWIAVIVGIVVVIFLMIMGGMSNLIQTYSVDSISSNNSINNNDVGQSFNVNMNNNKIEGLQIKDVVVGTGAEAVSGKKVTVHYTGTFINGVKFDSSVDRNQPFEFTLGVGQVIPGWDEGVAGMKVGGKRLLAIPSSKAYGEAGAPPVIEPNTDLLFEVELLGVK